MRSVTHFHTYGDIIDCTFCLVTLNEVKRLAPVILIAAKKQKRHSVIPSLRSGQALRRIFDLYLLPIPSAAL
jgi:hypothetical protein